MANLRFSTPTIVATPAALTLLSHLGTNPVDLVKRHFAGEWGGDADNSQVNERYLADGEGMLLSIFAISDERIWVISHVGNGEDDYTTILMPEEY